MGSTRIGAQAYFASKSVSEFPSGLAGQNPQKTEIGCAHLGWMPLRGGVLLSGRGGAAGGLLRKVFW